MLTLFRQEDFTQPIDATAWDVKDVTSASQWGPASNMPQQGWCVPKAANVECVNGLLRLTTRKQQVDTVPYTFAYLQSRFALVAPFRIEATVRLPLGTDVWSNPVWTYKSHWEIDPLEVLTRPDGGSANHTVHGVNADGTTFWQQQAHVWHGASWFAMPHALVIDAQLDRIRMLVDGVQVAEVLKAARHWLFDSVGENIILRGVKAGGWNHTAPPVTPSPCVTDILALAIYTEQAVPTPPPPPTPTPPSDPRVTAKQKLVGLGLTDAEADVVVNP